jgi:uncharacterized protein
MGLLGFELELVAICVVAGLLGSLLGLGGGIIVVPVLTLMFHVPIRLAIGASVISVIATSSGAAAAYVRERLTNIRIGMLLEVGTTTGAITGAYIAGLVDARVLFIVFGLVLGYSALQMLRKRHDHASTPVPPDAWADRLRLHDSYYDQAEGRDIDYRVTHTPAGLSLMYVAGTVSGLLGIGSGALKVPAMDLAMHLPIKVSTATSNFMIGVTAAASAGVYFARGDIDPFIAGPVAVGVLIGATIGARYLPRIGSGTIRVLFVAVLVAIACEMLLKGIR